jgi:hypothetical protein
VAARGFLVMLTLILTIMFLPEDPPGLEGYRQARVGDWVSWRCPGEDGESKYTVKAKTAERVTVRLDITSEGKTRTLDIDIDLRPGVKNRVGGLPEGGRTITTERIATGNEVLTIAGRRYACRWVTTRYVATSKSGEREVLDTSTDWFCPEVPLSGRVRTETGEGEAKKVTAELAGFGRGN